MQNFSYIARDRIGKKTQGVIVARDPHEARQLLRNKELFVTDIRIQAEKSETEASRGMFGSGKVKLGDMVVMSRQLATLVRAGISIVESLRAAAEQTENSALSQALQDVRLEVMTGNTLTGAMRKKPKIFSDKYIALVQAGEVGGVLEQTLEIAADQFNREAELREKIRAAFVYPILVLFASVGVVTFMLVFIVPVFAKVYDEFNAKLPAVTLLLVSLSSIVVHLWWLVILGIIALVLGVRRLHKTVSGRFLIDRIVLNIPVLGKLNRKIAISRFTETLAGSTMAGVPILQALSISSETSGNVVIMRAVSTVSDSVKQGLPLAEPLEQTGQFPPMVTRMIAAGEQSGNLDEMLQEITKFFHRDIEYTVEKLTRMLEPAMTIVVGGIVLFVLLALYMPIFNLTSVLRK